MHQHSVNLRLPLLETEEIRALTDRPCSHTNKLVEEAFFSNRTQNKDLDESDWSSISLLQKEIKDASNALKVYDWQKKKVSPFNPDSRYPSSGRIQIPKIEKLERELKEKQKIINELRKKNYELERTIRELQYDKEELTKINLKLKNELNEAITECQKISKTIDRDEKKLPDILKYTHFLMKSLKENNEFRVLFEDRITPTNYLSFIMEEKYDTALLISLQILSDVIVHLMPLESLLNEYQSEDKTYEIKNEDVSMTITSEDSSLIFHQIDAQSQRMVKLNQEIAHAMGKIK
mmetsp:Transcript_21734/g.21490  ORF Transcript_21734/g.21490 Transcript_21734/m.21490 type:complete len:292 (+) Transcript_21734:42-917(+)